MEVVKGKLLGKVEILVCIILRDFSTVIKFGLTSTTSEGSDQVEGKMTLSPAYDIKRLGPGGTNSHPVPCRGKAGLPHTCHCNSMICAPLWSNKQF
jgi:hypothetical protein